MAGYGSHRLTRKSLELLEKQSDSDPKSEECYIAAMIREEQYTVLRQQGGLLEQPRRSEPAEAAKNPPKFKPQPSSDLENDLKLVRGFAGSFTENPVKRFLTPGHRSDPLHLVRQGLDDLQAPYACGESLEKRNDIARLHFKRTRNQDTNHKRRRSSDLVVEVDDTRSQ